VFEFVSNNFLLVLASADTGRDDKVGAEPTPLAMKSRRGGPSLTDKQIEGGRMKFRNWPESERYRSSVLCTCIGVDRSVSVIH